jgi:uncharacterized protein YukJ
MSLDRYGVLIAGAVERRRESSTDTPHFQIHALDAGGDHYRIAVNVQSQQSPSELLYVLDQDLRHPVTAELSGLAHGWHALASRPGEASLDYVRANLFDPAQMRPLAPDLTGPDNDLADLLDHYVTRAIGDQAATLHVFGQRWGPEPGKPDKVFGFSPGGGVHDVHMNQGNSGQFRRDDGVWQDGAMLIHYPAEPRWVGIFLAFQSQAWHTDDVTGHAIGAVAPAPQATSPGVRIVAALVNPVGPAPERETVLLLNALPDPVDVTGWRISDRLKRTCPVPAGTLAAGATLEVVIGGEVQLGNQGGTITLLDGAGLKVAGVSYTAAQAGQEGQTIVF